MNAGTGCGAVPWTAMIVAALGLPLPVAAQTRTQLAEARLHMDSAAAALRTARYARAEELFHRALVLRPQHPMLHFGAAAAAARQGAADRALEQLRRAADLGLFMDDVAAGWFTGLDSVAAIRDERRRLAHNGAPIIASTVAFRLDDPHFLPEGIAWDPVTTSFFIGSVHRRIIVRVAGDGAASTFVPPAHDLWGVLGMAVDAPRRSLWVTTSALPQSADIAAADSGRTAVYRYHIDTGRREASFEVRDGGQHFTDVAIDPATGDAFVSDARSGAVMRIDRGTGAMTPLVDGGVLDSPQGMVVLPERQALIVADYGTGLWRIDLRTRQRVRIAAPASLHTIGIDGLAVHDGTLIAVQNYPQPHRVLRLFLDADATAITTFELLEVRHPEHAEPTLGVVVGDAFHYVANSQWSKFGGSNGTAEPRPPVVLRLPLR